MSYPVLASLLLLAAPIPLQAADEHKPSHALAAPPAVIKAIIETGMQQSLVMETLDELVNGIGPRLTGSEGLAAAEAWAVAEFRKLGLEARLEQWGETPVGFDRGPWVGSMVAPETMDLEFITRAWSAGTDGPLRGPLVLAPRDEDELAALDGGLAGAWVITPSDWPPRPSPRTAPEEMSEDEQSTWFQEARAAHNAFTTRRTEAYEAAGIAGQLRSARGELLVMGGRMNIDFDDLPSQVSITLLASQFDDLLGRLEEGQAVELEFDIQVAFREGPIPQHNVVADMLGSEKPDEYVIVGGHLDSWDGADGATDNGTGVATTLEAARLLVESGARPARTIRFMLWGGEEQGLLGSRGWVSENADVMPNISAVFVHDNGTNALTGLSITRGMQEQMQIALAPVLEFSETVEGAEPFALEVVGGLAMGASDHNPFLQENVPGFFWRQTGRVDYDHTHHTQHDTYEQVIPEYQRHSAVVVALTALGVADLPEMLERKGLRQKRRTLGIFLEDDGVTVSRVVSSSQAGRLGVEDGDRFVSVNELPVGPGELLAARDQGEGRKLIAWVRGGDDGSAKGDDNGDGTDDGASAAAPEGTRHSAIFEWDEGHIDRYPEEFVVQTADGVDIHGDYFMGSTEGPAAGSAVILLHMNRGDRHGWIPVRDDLYTAGIATLAIDLRGHGQSVDAAGHLAQAVEARDPAHYAAMVQDVVAAVTFLEARGYARSRIGLMGASVGCSVALAAAVDDPGLAGVVALTPGTRYLDQDSAAEIAAWDDRPLLLVSSQEEADGGARPLHDALLARDPWTSADLVLLDHSSIHGTHMFGTVDGVESRLADWWAGVLAE